MEVAGREVRGPLAEAVRELWFLRGPAPARYERIFPMTDVHLIVNLSPTPYRVLDAADAVVAAVRQHGAALLVDGDTAQ